METREEIYERHKNKVDELEARLNRLHQTVAAMEAIDPRYAKSVTPSKGDLSSSETLRQMINNIMTTRRKHLANILKSDNFMEYHQMLERSNGILEKSISKLEKKAEEIVPDIRKGLKKRLAAAESYEDEQKIIEQHRQILTPAEIEQVASEVHGQLIQESLNKFVSRKPKERGELTQYWVKRFGRGVAKEIAQQAMALLTARKGKEKREKLEQHEILVEHARKDSESTVAMEGTNENGERFAVVLRPKKNDYYVITNGVATALHQMDKMSESMRAIIRQKVLGREEQQEMDGALGDIEGMLSEGITPDASVTERKGERKPLAERLVEWIGKADDDFMANIFGKDTEEAHEMLDALDAMKDHEKGVKDFTSRVGEKNWDDVLKVARAINKLKKEPERLETFLKEAEKVDFEGTLRLAQNT